MHVGRKGLPVSLPISTVFLIFLYRCFLGFTLATQESPDEWWQSAEVGYYLAFGRGHLTWEWVAGIRSVVHPGIFGAAFYFLRVLGLDTAVMVHIAERLVQCAILSCLDVLIFSLGARIDSSLSADAEEGEAAARRKRSLRTPLRNAKPDAAAEANRWCVSNTVAHTALHLSLVQWFMCVDGVRSYSNVAEAVAVLFAFLQTDRVPFLLAAAGACMLRVTAALAILPIFLLHVRRAVQRSGWVKGLAMTLGIGTLVGVVALGLLACVDYLFYHRWMITPFNFLKYNVFLGVSTLYGTHPLHWYLTVGLGVVGGPHVLFLCLLPGILQQCQVGERTRRLLCEILFVGGVTLALHSLSAHKEFRFIFPVLPLTLVLVAYVIVTVFTLGKTVTQRLLVTRWGPVVTANRASTLYHLFVVINLVLISFFLCGYRRGGPAIMRVIRYGSEHYDSIDLLVPCYFTPGYSHVHGKVRLLRHIPCDVVINPTTGRRVETQDELFRERPPWYIHWRYNRRPPPDVKDELLTVDAQHWLQRIEDIMSSSAGGDPLPSAMVLFTDTATNVTENFLRPYGYTLRARRLHAIFHSFEPDEDLYVELWTRQTL